MIPYEGIFVALIFFKALQSNLHNTFRYVKIGQIIYKSLGMNEYQKYIRESKVKIWSH